MCGIGGFFGRAPRSAQVAERMLASLRRRGPDAEHVQSWNESFGPASGGFATHVLLHTRLAIIDPNPEAEQPMANDAGDIWICYNGEVYGWQQDADVLRHRGATFRTRSDTEFILRAYEAWGIDCLHKLRGMFALAIVDLRRGEVHLARDRMGLKPLLYCHEDGEFAFASLVRTLLPFLPREKRQLSTEGIDAFLAHRTIPAPRTVFRSIQRLENGHRLRYHIASGTLEKKCYWQPVPSFGADWNAVLDEAVALRTAADRPLGIFLSGGLDSALVAGRLAATGHGGLNAFTAAFPGTGYDESDQALTSAGRFGLASHIVTVPDTLGDDFSRLVADLDEPFADPSAFPSWYLARETVRHVTVVLGGDGGDELFAGYKRYRSHLRSAWRRGFTLPLPLLSDVMPKGWKKNLVELALPWDDAYILRFSGFTPNQRRFLQPDLKAPPHYWRQSGLSTEDPLASLLEIDRLNYLPEYILRKADLCTMAHGLELRAPLLDHRLYEATLALPSAERFTTPPKRRFAQACPELDAMGLFSAKKRGFNPPLERWLSEDLKGRFTDLGSRLAFATDGQMDEVAVDRFAALYRNGASGLAEQMLQLLILDESLLQLGDLVRMESP